MNTEIILYNLYILASIKVDEKVGVNESKFYISSTLQRLYYSEDRFNTIEQIENVIDQAIKHKNEPRFSVLCDLIPKIQTGMSNLKYTYREDQYIYDRIEYIIKKLEE